MDIKIVLGLWLIMLAATVTGLAVHTKSPPSAGNAPISNDMKPDGANSPDHSTEYGLTYSVPDRRTGDPRRQADNRPVSLLLGTYSFGHPRNLAPYSVPGFAAGGAALFVKAPAGPGVPLHTPTLSYATAEPFIRLAYASPVVTVGEDVSAKEHAVVLVPSAAPARPESTPDARVVSVSVQNAQGQTLQPVVIQHVPTPTPSPAPVVEPHSATPTALIQLVQTRTSEVVPTGPPATRLVPINAQPSLSPRKSQQLLQESEEDVVDIGGVKGQRKDQPVGERVQLQSPFFFNAHPVSGVPFLAGLGHAPAPIFLFEHRPQPSQPVPPGAHRTVFPSPYVDFAPQTRISALSIRPSSPTALPYPQRDPVHFATAPGYTSTVFTSFSSPYVSYSY